MSSKGIKKTTPDEKANEIIGYCLNKQIPLPLKNAFAVKIPTVERNDRQTNEQRNEKKSFITFKREP